MQPRDSWLCATVAAVILCGAPKPARTEPRAPPSAEPTPPPHVHVVLVGRAQDDPTLSRRICTLFDLRTGCDVDAAVRLDSSAVLRPDSYETVYVWIALATETRARVYVSTREQDTPRYLFRDVTLESGLDEVGEETLAQIAHSSALALWAREQESPAGEVAALLQQDTESPTPTVPSNNAAASAPGPRKAPRSPIARHRAPMRPARSGPTPLRVDLGARYAAYLSGAEGLHHEPGAFGSAIYQEQLGLTLAAAYATPSRFDVGPAHVTMEGACVEARVSRFTGPARGVRLRLDAGAGTLWVHWKATAEAPATAAPGHRRLRGYALGAVAVEIPARPLWIGARIELRVPFQKATYDIAVDGHTTTEKSTWLSPGLGLELGLPLERRP